MKKLLALAVAFGVITEGLTKEEQVQEALNANEAYKMYLRALAANEDSEKALKDLQQSLDQSNENLKTALTAKELAENKAKELQASLDGSNNENAALKEKLEQFAAAEEAANADKVVYTNTAGDKYEITQSEFRYKGELYKAAEVITNHPELIDELIEAKAFFIKKV